MPRTGPLALVLLLLGAATAAQETPDVQARRLLEDGRAYWAQGKLKQALDNFQTIVTSFPQTPSVGLALLEVGRYRMEVEGDLEKARAAFEQVSKQYAQSDGAPGAYYYLGRLTLARAVTTVDLDDALAQLTRVHRLYPKSDWVPRALEASAQVHRRAGRYADAVDVARRVSFEYPSSDAAPGAQFLVGQSLALMGEHRAAMEEFQAVRNRFPTSEWAARSLDRVTALWRLHSGAKPTFSLDSTFAPAGGEALKALTALLVTPDGTLWMNSDKSKSALAFDTAGKPVGSVAGADLGAFSLSPRGDVMIAAKTALRIGLRDIRTFQTPPQKPGAAPEPLEKILAAVETPGGSFLVSDGDRAQLLRFDARLVFKGTFPENEGTKEREITRVFVDGEGEIVALDRREKTVRFLDETGKTIRTIGPVGLKKPIDVAVDPFRNVYVADEENGVLVFSPQGQLLFTLSSAEIKRPAAIALDTTGAILVHDEKAQKLLRFR